MKSVLFKFGLTVIVLIVSFSCKNQNDNTVKNETDSSQTVVNEPSKVDKFDYPTFIIAVDATPDYDSAKAKVEKLKKDFPDAGFLWIPDYKTLSGNDKFAIYTASGGSLVDLWETFDKTKKKYPYAYMVLAADTGNRITVFGKFDYRINDKRINVIIPYDEYSLNRELSPEEEDEIEEYNEESGDWGFFVNDVMEFFNKATDKVVVLSSYKVFSQSEVNKMIEDIEGFDPQTNGYILINEKGEKMFIQHDIPMNIIKTAVDFFGLPFDDEQINSIMNQ